MKDLDERWGGVGVYVFGVCWGWLLIMNDNMETGVCVCVCVCVGVCMGWVFS